MTAKEIMQALKAGAIVERKKYMTFKRNKIVRGIFKIEIWVNEKRITQKQYEGIQYLLTKVSEDFNSKTYKLKTE